LLTRLGGAAAERRRPVTGCGHWLAFSLGCEPGCLAVGRSLLEAACSAYAAALASADDDKQRLAAQRAAAIALSEHINESLLEPPLVE
jgi:hypothetical protein